MNDYILKELLESHLDKIDINKRDSYNETPLMSHVQNGPIKEVVEMFINKGADLKVKNNQMKTLVDLCADETISKLLKSKM